MKIVLGNLPDGVDEGDIEELMAQYGAVASTELLKEDDSDRMERLVVLEDVSRVAADAIAEKLNGYYWKGVQVTARVPVFQDDDDAAGKTRDEGE